MDLESQGIDLTMLGSFDLNWRGRAVSLGATGERLVALLALRRGRPSSRASVAGWLWPERAGSRAAGNLRSVIWRLPAHLVETNSTHLRLADAVRSDVSDFTARAQRLIDGAADVAQGDLNHELYLADLLPTWDEDWVTVERERIRQLRIHALDALSTELTRAGRYSDAIAAGLASVAAEPLRETAHGVVIRAHLAEGNHCEAIRQYETFCALLERELGLAPSPRLAGLIHHATRHSTPV